jgi:hypothetical protein
VTQDKQLALFPAAAAATQPVSPVHLRLAKRGIRTVRARGPLRVKDLAMILGADIGDMWTAVGVARQWRRLEVRDGIAALAVPRDEGAAT